MAAPSQHRSGTAEGQSSRTSQRPSHTDRTPDRGRSAVAGSGSNTNPAHLSTTHRPCGGSRAPSGGHRRSRTTLSRRGRSRRSRPQPGTGPCPSQCREPNVRRPNPSRTSPGSTPGRAWTSNTALSHRARSERGGGRSERTAGGRRSRLRHGIEASDPAIRMLVGVGGVAAHPTGHLAAVVNA
jgi:hypothetical protein